jgi:hypothetical protein
MKKSNLKWTSRVMVIMLFAFITSCNNGQQEQNNAGESESTEMGEGMEMNDMEGMDMSQHESNSAAADAAAVNMVGEPAFMQDYVDIRDALVNDNYEKVKQAASGMQNSLEESKLKKEQRTKLKSNLSQLTEAKEIDAQRKAFSQLSQQLYQVVQKNDVTDKALYWQHCPMAMGNQGANWLSYEEQVRNPYMGQRMPGCGSVQETIN